MDGSGRPRLSGWKRPLAEWGSIMAARSDFWLVVHQLATCLEAEGQTRAERSESIVDALMAMPRAARIQLKRELSLILDELVPLPPEITRRESTKSDSGFFNFLKDIPKTS